GHPSRADIIPGTVQPPIAARLKCRLWAYKALAFPSLDSLLGGALLSYTTDTAAQPLQTYPASTSAMGHTTQKLMLGGVPESRDISSMLQ
ncbi:Hypothetical predicted protein, partial [Pelobates cultripes]